MKRIFTTLFIALTAILVTACNEPKSAPQDLTFTQLMEQTAPEQVEAWYNGSTCLSARSCASRRSCSCLTLTELSQTTAAQCPTKAASCLISSQPKGITS